MDARLKEEIDAIMLECQSHLAELYKSCQVIIDAGLASETKCCGRAMESKGYGRSIYRNEGDDWQRFFHRSPGHGSSNLDSPISSDRTDQCGRAFDWGIENYHYLLVAQNPSIDLDH